MITREYVIKSDGQILRRSIDERPISITKEALAHLSVAPSAVRNVMPLGGYGPVHFSIESNAVVTYVTVPLPSITLRAPFKLLKKDSILVPNFNSETDPVMSIEWTPPLDCRVRMLCQCEPGGAAVHLSNQWLFALDPHLRTWRLPLPNTHDDCNLCTGEKSGEYGATIVEALDKALTRFAQSVWNNDLWDGVEQTHSMFRFKPGEKKSFLQLPVEGDWSQYCKKVAVAISSHLVV